MFSGIIRRRFEIFIVMFLLLLAGCTSEAFDAGQSSRALQKLKLSSDNKKYFENYSSTLKLNYYDFEEALANNQFEIVDLIFTKWRMDFGMKSMVDEGFVFQAARRNNPGMISWLASKSVDFDVFNTSGSTPVISMLNTYNGLQMQDRLICSDHEEFLGLELLLRHGANPNEPSDLPPLQLARILELCKEIEAILLSYGAVDYAN